MKPRLSVLAALLIVLVAVLACGDDDGGASPTGSATGRTPSPTASRTPGDSGSVTPSPSGTAVPSQEPTLPPEGVLYTVEPGDTLYSIARRFGTTVEAIAEANGIADPTQINEGQVLVIPGASQTPAPTLPPTEPPDGGAPATVLRYGDTSRRAVALTFDAGSDAGYTVQILDTLKANGLRASFGMTGRWAETYPDLLRRIVTEGHTLINHSYSHASFTGASTGAAALTQAERWDELDRTEAIVQQLSGATTQPYFRPPYGDFDQSVNEDVGAKGYAYNVMWTVDSRGWMGLSAPAIEQRCLDLAEPGAIYVFHVGSASQDGPALQGIIDGLRSAGYEITDVSGVLP